MTNDEREHFEAFAREARRLDDLARHVEGVAHRLLEACDGPLGGLPDAIQVAIRDLQRSLNP